MRISISIRNILLLFQFLAFILVDVRFYCFPLHVLINLSFPFLHIIITMMFSCPANYAYSTDKTSNSVIYESGQSTASNERPIDDVDVPEDVVLRLDEHKSPGFSKKTAENSDKKTKILSKIERSKIIANNKYLFQSFAKRDIFFGQAGKRMDVETLSKMAEIYLKTRGHKGNDGKDSNFCEMRAVFEAVTTLSNEKDDSNDLFSERIKPKYIGYQEWE